MGPVDFRKTLFHDSVRQNEADSTKVKKEAVSVEGRCEGTLIRLKCEIR